MKQFALFPPAAAALCVGLAGCGGDLTLPASTPTVLNLAVLQGDGQTGTVGQPLPNPVVVVVRTDAGVPIPDRQVVFAQTAIGTDDTFDPATVVTDAQGKALTHWVLGTTPGAYSAQATVVPQGDTVLPVPVQLQAAAVADAPDSVRADGPAIQTGRRGEPVPEPLVVAVVDRYGNPVAGVEVTWKTEHGNGEVSPAEGTVTDADGRSGVTWTLGNRIGIQQATAEVHDLIGSPVTFSATVAF
jgi:Big-like domain-containing protein